MSNNGEKASVVIVEDHAVVSEGLSALINDEHDLSVVAAVSTTAEAMAAVKSQRPDAVIVDIMLDGESGIDVIRQIHEHDEKIAILALSMHDEALYAERALRAGARGYIMKREATDKVLSALRKVLAGEISVSEKVSAKMVHKVAARNGATITSPLERLSDREFEIFNLIGQGVGPSEIANRLSVSVKTVETHREHIKAKMGFKTGSELLRFAIQHATNLI